MINQLQLFTYQLHKIQLEDSRNHALNGVLIINNQTMQHHEFILAYNGSLLYQREPIHIMDEYINKLILSAYELCDHNKPIIKEYLIMTNQERLLMEIEGIELKESQLKIYLAETGLDAEKTYNTASTGNKKAIYQAALAILQSIANQPALMKNYKQDDLTISNFSEQLQKRIIFLENTIRQMPTQDENTSYFNLFSR